METLGRGGFLVHQDVPGIREEYPDLVTYPRGDVDALLETIGRYLEDPVERERVTEANFTLVRDRYTCAHKCAELLKLCEG